MMKIFFDFTNVDFPFLWWFELFMQLAQPCVVVCDCNDHIFIQKYMLIQVLVKMHNCEKTCWKLVVRVLLENIIEYSNKYFDVFINSGFYLWELLDYKFKK